MLSMAAVCSTLLLDISPVDAATDLKYDAKF